MSFKTHTTRVNDINDDDILSDPLPQPFRFINKLLLRVVEEAIDLAEDGGSSASSNAFVCHNLRLTKVGRMPLKKHDNFELSTEISPYEIISYTQFANTPYYLIATSQGNIIIYDFNERNTIANLSISTISKQLTGKTISQVVSAPSDYGNFAVVFLSEETCYMLLLSSSYQLKSTTEIDVSDFFLKTIKITTSGQNFVISDGNGKMQIYSCKSPADMTAEGGQPTNGRSSQMKQAVIEPLLDIARCPISTGPVRANSPIQAKTEEASKKKPAPKKKPVAPVKGKARAKSPIEVVPETPEIINEYFPSYRIFGSIVAVMFGNFPVIQLYNIDSEQNPQCEFQLPSAVTALLEVPQQNTLIIGLDNGTFCFLNVKRRQIYGHQFLKQGKITDLLLFDNCLVVCTEQKVIAAFRLENMRASEMLYQCSDSDIVSIHKCGEYLFTYNQKPKDLTIRQALLSVATYGDGKTVPMLPNVSVLNAATGKYIGTLSTPSELIIDETVWSGSSAIVVYADPIEEPTLVKEEPKEVQEQPAPKKGDKKESKKTSKRAKKEEVVEEAPLIIKKQIIAFIDLVKLAENFVNVAKEGEKATQMFAMKHQMISSSSHIEKVDSKQLL